VIQNGAAYRDIYRNKFNLITTVRMQHNIYRLKILNIFFIYHYKNNPPQPAGR